MQGRCSVTASQLYTISRKAANLLKRRGFEVVWSVSLREPHSPETFVGYRGHEDILHVKLKLSPNTLKVGEEIAKFCEDEIRILRRFMRARPEKTGEHYEIWISMPGGNYFTIEVLPEMLKDKESGAVLSPLPGGGAAP
jgi:hypothetical protein